MRWRRRYGADVESQYLSLRMQPNPQYHRSRQLQFILDAFAPKKASKQAS